MILLFLIYIKIDEVILNINDDEKFMKYKKKIKYNLNEIY